MRLAIAALTAVLVSFASQAHAFCGFYVARGDADLFNEASKVVMVRDGNRTVITMVNDFQGDVSDFAMVIPAPTVLKREQIHVTNGALIDHLDAYTAPRLVEYFDPDPCRPQPVYRTQSAGSAQPEAAINLSSGNRDKALGVTIEAQYSVGEYDILILSAEQSDGLQIWLDENGYRPPNGAETVLKSYIDQGMKFFVAKVNLETHAKSGAAFLSPLQIAFESKDFMLPIRLGMLNAKGSQDLLLWTLTRRGRVETTNYRTVKMPTGQDIPTYVKSDFGMAYKDIFGESVRKEGGAAVMMEYAWDMAWCDPCAADPLSNTELRELGVFWVDKAADGLRLYQTKRAERIVDIAKKLGITAGELARFNGTSPNRKLIPGAVLRIPPDMDVPENLVIRTPNPGRPPDVFVTRLHARYDEESFPEDLRLSVTDDRENFQGRYVLRHPWKGLAQCPAGEEYRRSLPARFEREAQVLANLTGWDIGAIRTSMKAAGSTPEADDDWWEKIWKD